MLTKIEVDNLQGSTLSLPLQDSSSGYILKRIEGLDPVKATIVSSAFAQLDGSEYQGSRRENRDIAITIGMEPYYGASTVSELRAALYAFFMPKTTVIISFFIDDVKFASITGMVEDTNVPLFTKDPELTVSLMCFDPNFIAPTSTVVAGNTVTDTTEQTIAYPGTIEAGYLFTLNVDQSIPGFTIYNRRPNGDVATLEFTYALVAGDVVKISTLSRSKYATLTRAASTSSALYGVSSVAKWGPLYPGNNFFRVLSSAAAIPFTVEYTTKYGGL